MSVLNKQKLLVLSQRFPPGIGGTPTVMGNLCAALPEELIEVISLAERNEVVANASTSDRPQRLPHPNKWRRKFDPAFLSLIPRIVKAARSSTSEPPLGVLAVYPGTSFMLAAYFYSQKHKLPLYPYFMDTWEEGRGRKWERAISAHFEPKVFSAAKFVFVLTPALEAFFKNKYPQHADKIRVLPHSILNPEVIPSPDPKWQHDGLHVVYTGQVYGPTADPINLLLESFKQLRSLNPLLTISSPDSELSLRSYGLFEHPDLRLVRLKTSEEVARLQASADILFNPVSFSNAHKLQVQTLFPTKTIEYLRTRRPMLVCGPKSTAFVQYAKKKNFAHISDEPSVEQLSRLCKDIYQGSNHFDLLSAIENELIGRDSNQIAKQLLEMIIVKKQE